MSDLQRILQNLAIMFKKSAFLNMHYQLEFSVVCTV